MKTKVIILLVSILSSIVFISLFVNHEPEFVEVIGSNEVGGSSGGDDCKGDCDGEVSGSGLTDEVFLIRDNKREGTFFFVSSVISLLSTLITSFVLVRSFSTDRKKKKLEIEMLEIDLAQKRSSQE